MFPRLSESFTSYFAERGEHDEGEYGKAIALAYPITAAVSIIPYLGCCTAIAALVLLII